MLHDVVRARELALRDHEKWRACFYEYGALRVGLRPAKAPLLIVYFVAVKFSLVRNQILEMINTIFSHPFHLFTLLLLIRILPNHNINNDDILV